MKYYKARLPSETQTRNPFITTPSQRETRIKHFACSILLLFRSRVLYTYIIQRTIAEFCSGSFQLCVAQRETLFRSFRKWSCFRAKSRFLFYFFFFRTHTPNVYNHIHTQKERVLFSIKAARFD